MKIEKHRVIPGKLPYAQGQRPAVDCILCAVARKDPTVTNLLVFRHQNHLVSLNLFPYNAGHVLIFPERHVLDIRELSEQDVLLAFRLQVLSLRVLEQEYHPAGFNVGYNIGSGSGASIAHLHLHLVPRFRSELGFFDILSDSRAIVEDPHTTQQRLSKAYEELAPSVLGTD